MTERRAVTDFDLDRTDLGRVLGGVRSTDPVTIVTIALLVCGVSVLATLGPARRAMRVDPMEALRSE